MSFVADADLYARLRGILTRGWITIPDYHGYRGTGAPGTILEELLGIDGTNRDTPDSGKWEIKFHSQSSLLTLFHLEAQPKGHMHHMVRKFGWLDAKGRTSFRHTIHGRSDKGFYVMNESNRLTVRNDSVSDMVWPYWTHDSLMNAFAAKFRRLIVVKGKKQNGQVKYETAHLYWEPQITLFVEAVEKGIIAVDFDARTNNGRGLRNHGTKFRIQYDNLRHIYNNQQKFG